MIDTNILFSFFRENPVRTLIINASSFNVRLITPEEAIDELRDNKDALIKYSKLSEEEVEYLIFVLEHFVEVKPITFFQEFKEEANRTSPDFKDAPFFALALKLNAAIWSNEPRLKRQSKVKVFSTREIMEELGINQ